MRGETVWLVGMMGAGKSTLGARLARRMRIEFQDTDSVVKAKTRMEIDEIFSKLGEPAFRRLESGAITSLAGRKAVVALGGGALLQKGAINRLRKNGVVIYLRARPETLALRLADNPRQHEWLQRLKRLVQPPQQPQQKQRKRLDRLARKRPLIEDAGSTSPEQIRPWLAQLLAEREPVYLQSDLVVDTDDRGADALVEELAQQLQPEVQR